MQMVASNLDGRIRIQVLVLGIDVLAPAPFSKVLKCLSTELQVLLAAV